MCWSAWWWRTDEEEHKMKKTTSTGAILSYCLRQCLGDDYDGVLHLIYDSTRQTQCSPATGNSHKQQPLIMYVWWGFGAVRLTRLIEFCFQMQFSTTMHTNHYWWNLICIYSILISHLDSFGLAGKIIGCILYRLQMQV